MDRTRPKLQLRPGQIERRTHDYKRHGTTNLYAAFDILTGEVFGRLTQRHRSREFLDFLKQVDRNTPQSLDLHLIFDNSSTHKTEAVRTWLEAHPRIKVHFTPTSASWLNAVESWFSILERRSLRRGAFNSVQDLRKSMARLTAFRICANLFKLLSGLTMLIPQNRSNGQRPPKLSSVL
jgi:transposase